MANKSVGSLNHSAFGDGLLEYRQLDFLLCTSMGYMNLSFLLTLHRFMLFYIGLFMLFLWILINIIQGTQTWLWGAASTLRITTGSMNLNTSAIFINTLIANSPQVILSFLYFYIDNILTVSSSAKE